MSVNQDGVSELRRAWIKTAEQQLFHELEIEYGFPKHQDSRERAGA